MKLSTATRLSYDNEAQLGVSVRAATVTDYHAIIQFYCKQWQQTYHGIVNDEYLSQLTNSNVLHSSFQNMLLPWRHQVKVLLAHSGDKIVGLAAGGPYRSELLPGEAENYALYIDSDFQGRGLGWRMWQARARLLAADGATKLHTWVLEPNNNAQNVYRAWGAQPATPWQRQVQFGQQQMSEVHYTWDL